MTNSELASLPLLLLGLAQLLGWLFVKIQQPVETSPIARTPKLIVINDMNDYPANARCSACGEAMPMRRSWITSSSDNLVWFEDQFRRHVEKGHPGSVGAETPKDPKHLSA